MDTIQVFVKDVSTGNIFEIPFTSLNYVEELNNGYSATLNLDYPSIEAIAKSYGITAKSLFCDTFREVSIQLNGTVIWLGVVSEYDRSKDASGGFTLTVGCIDYFSLLQKCRTGLTEVDFTGVDPATIPWSLISTHQALSYADFGITVGATASTGLSVTMAYKNAELRTEIINLSNAKVYGSFDFDIDYAKKLNIYYPTKGSTRNDLVFDDNNILANTVKCPVVLNLTNSVFVVGQALNGVAATVNRQASNSEINQYKLLEDTISDSNNSDTTILNAEGDKFLSLNKLPIYQITLKHEGDDPYITNYNIGDTVVVNIPEEGIAMQSYRIKRRTVDIDQAGEIIATLDLLII